MRDLDRYSEDYVTLPFEDVQVHYRRRHLLEILGRSNPRSLLEVGCGMEPLFLHYGGFQRMHVVEPAEKFHARAFAAATGRGNVTVHLGTLQQVAPLLTAVEFDCVLMSSLLHEVPNPIELLQTVRVLCAPETTLQIAVPNANSLHRLLAVEMGLAPDVRQLSATQVRMQQSTTFECQSLHALLDAAGFEVIESGSFFIKPFTHEQMALLREHRVLTDAMLDGLYALSRRLPDIGSELYAVARLKR